MDPRPYTYQFRKPRLSNPTYKSDYLYGSIYHPGAYKMQPNVDKISNNSVHYAQNSKEYGQFGKYDQRINEEIRRIDPSFSGYLTNPQQKIKRVQQNKSIDKFQNTKIREQSEMRQNKSLFDDRRNNSLDKTRSNSTTSQKMSMSGYGGKYILPSPKRAIQDTIFQKQQKPYNIINCYPKQVTNTHRTHPKYTLQDKLIQTGLYPYFATDVSQR